MSFTSDFPRETGEAYTSLGEAKDSESYKGFVALVRRMNKYRREALIAFANPSKAKRKRDIAEVFATIEHALQDNTLTEKIEGESKNVEQIIGKSQTHSLKLFSQDEIAWLVEG